VRVNSRVPRRIGHPQMAFVRSWAEGLDLTAAWERYLYVDGQADARRARGELQRLLDQLRSVARAHGRPDLAALLRRDPEAMPDNLQARLTLDEFRLQQPDDFYSEAELLVLYQAAHAAPADTPTAAGTGAARRRQRLRARLVAALQWLEPRAALAPQPADAVAGWLDERVATRLAAVGIVQLCDLVAWMTRHGYHWHRDIPRLGPQGAARLVRWLDEHTAQLGSLPARVRVPPRLAAADRPAPLPRVGVVPVERFNTPTGLDGSQGSNRAPAERCKLPVNHDLAALQAWLRLRPEGSHTWRAYRKEGERFLLWAVLERRKPVSSLTGDDCVAYRDFLRAPGPAWTGPRHEPRWSEAWRPFEDSLSARSAATAVTIVRAWCEWLVRRHYLDSNPWDDVPQRADAPSMPQLRALSPRQWGHVLAWLQAQQPTPAHRRLQFIMTFAYCTGMRLAELAAARVAWLRHEPLDDGEWVWSVMVLGKRNKWREVPLPDVAVESFREYLTDRGLNPDFSSNDPAAPLIAHVDSPDTLSAARIYEVLVEAFERCARELALQDPKAADRIRQASTHWLRHTHGSHAIARGVPPDVVQANLGHESLATTSIYVRGEQGRRHRAMQQAFGSTRPSGRDT